MGGDWPARVLAGCRKYWLAGLIILVPLVLIFPNLNAFPYPPHPGAYSDLAVTHYPNAIFLRQELLEHRVVPLWSPAILSGYPFFANPLSGLMYPPGWLALLFPLPAGFNLLVALHLILGAFGLVALLRAEGVGLQPSLLGGLVFILSPKFIAHYGAGHLTLIYAISWTPWLLWASRQQGKGAAGRLLWVQPGVWMAWIILADVRWSAYAGIAWWLYSIAHSHSKLRTVKTLFLHSSLACLLAAPLLIPLLEYASLSTRSLMTSVDILAFSLPPARLLSAAFPDFGGFHEWILYPGGAILCLSLLGIVRIRSSAAIRFWLGLALFCVLVALGGSIPGAELISQLPGVSLLRVPSRALFLLAICLSALVGSVVDVLSKGLPSGELRIARLILVGLSAYVLILLLGIGLISKKLPTNFIWGTGAVLLTCLGILFLLSQKGQRSWGIWFAALSCLILIDLWAVDRSMIVFRPHQEVISEGSPASAWLSSQPDLFRIYSPSYSLPQQTAARARLQLADGVDPLQLENYSRFMAGATGVSRPGYSVTLPSFGDADPGLANAGLTPDTYLLGLLNVRYIASEFEMAAPGLLLREKFDTTRVYENIVSLPRAWVQSEESAQGSQIVEAQVSKWLPNRIDINAQGPGQLILSEIAYPGWRARVDGAPVEIEEAAGLLRAVSLGAGDHQITFRFQPGSLYAGLGLAAIGLGFYFGFSRLQVARESRS